MKLRDFLLHHTNAGDFGWMCIGGHYVGCTYVDHEDIFINSINHVLLQRKVKGYSYENRDWISKPFLLVEID